MKHAFWIVLICLTRLLLCFQIGSIKKDFENDRIKRVIDMRTNVIKEHVIIRAINIRDVPLSEYYISIPDKLKLANFQVFIRNKLEHPLTTEFIHHDPIKQINHYKVIFDEPVKSKDKIVLETKVSYIHLLEPIPKKIPHAAKQHVMVENNIFYYSPYRTTDIKTSIRLPSRNVLKLVGGEPDYVGELHGDTITYGSYNDIEPFTFIPYKVHYEYLPAILTLTQLKREVEVSHWGSNLAVEEHFALKHDGAKLDKEFSRIEYMNSLYVQDRLNVLTKLSFELPKEARDVYYRDEVGNVSTSHFRTEKTKSTLEIIPRFPLFGGWKTTWYTGYNLPLETGVRYLTLEDRYILKVQFVENLKNMVADQVELKVVLPEGASIVDIHTSLNLDSIDKTILHTYFDSIGRPCIVFKKENVINEHELPIYISYKYSKLKFLQKPLVFTVIFFIVHLASILLSKLPYGLGSSLPVKVVSPIQRFPSPTPSREASPGIFDEPVAANTRLRKPDAVPIILDEHNKPKIISKKKKPSGKKANNNNK